MQLGFIYRIPVNCTIAGNIKINFAVYVGVRVGNIKIQSIENYGKLDPTANGIDYFLAFRLPVGIRAAVKLSKAFLLVVIFFIVLVALS